MREQGLAVECLQQGCRAGDARVSTNVTVRGSDLAMDGRFHSAARFASHTKLYARFASHLAPRQMYFSLLTLRQICFSCAHHQIDFSCPLYRQIDFSCPLHGQICLCRGLYTFRFANDLSTQLCAATATNLTATLSKP